MTLMYHIVDRRIWSEIAVSEEAFEAQLAHVRDEGYTVLTLSDVARVAAGEAPAPERGVHFTFDDGFADNLYSALPRMREYGVEPTMFVPTAAVGQGNAWNARSEDGLRHLDWHELERWLEGSGRIGGHTHAHETASDVGRAALRESIERNRRLLQDRLGVDPVAFSYPNGVVTRAARAEVARHYELAFTVTGGTWHPRRDRYRLNRYGVGRHVGVDEFARELDELFQAFGSSRTRLRRRLRGHAPPAPLSGPRVSLVVGSGDDDPGYPTGTRFNDLLAAGWDVHLLHTGDVFRHRALDDLPDRVLRERTHPPPERLRRTLPRLGLVTGLLRAAGRRPLRTVSALARKADPGVRYLRAVMLGLRPDVVHLRSDAAATWTPLGTALGARLVVEGDVRAVDSSLFEWEEPAPGTCLRALAIGPLSWTQGYEHLLQAVRVLIDRGVACECRIVGGGELESALSFACHQLGLSDAVGLFRPGGRPALVDHLRWADVLVNPALEPRLPAWLIHAQAGARPLVTTALPDGEDAPGLVVPPGDPDALADALELLSADADVRGRLAREGRRQVASLPSMAGQLDAFRRLYREVTEGPETASNNGTQSAAAPLRAGGG